MTMAALWVLLLTLCYFQLDFALSKPVPSPKSAWLRKSRPHRKGVAELEKRSVPGTACEAQSAATLTAPKENVWAGLTGPETASVLKWLFAQDDLNLTKAAKATEWDNSVLLVELMIPNKTDVLDYIDGNGPQPDRYAHVVLDHRASVNAYFGDILIGPLPINNKTTKWEPLTYPYTKKSGGRIRNLDADGDKTLYTDWLYKISAEIKDITLDLWGGTCLGLDNDTIDVWGIDPLWQDDGIYRWDTFWNYPTSEFDAETLLPLGLYFKSNVTGRDPSKWKVLGWLYNDIFYESTAAFRKAYFSKGFEKLAANVEGPWAQTDQKGSIMQFDTIYPVAPVAPAGSRYSVNKQQKFVKWMDFEFYIGFSRDTGMRLFDIKYKGQRVIYELGLEEALAHYAGNDPVQSGTSYLDSYYGFGPYSFELIKGYDCPAYATYLNSSFYMGETTHTHLDSICLFEMDPGHPMQHHTTSAYASATRNIFFTVRNICTVGNYDYMFSYEFYLDGTMHIDVRASGYIQSAYYAKNEDYGYHIHDALSGSMHDHVLNFKVDFDILGTANTVQTVTNVPVSQVYPWSNGKARNTMKIERALITSEDDGAIFYAPNSATQYKVVNLDKPNAYGEPRGYQIRPSDGTIHLTVQNSSNLGNAANWATHDLFVTKRKDTEPRSAHPYNSQDVAEPMIDFSAFLDGDNITQTDIVLWFNLGMHHVPQTGDLPNTVFTTAHSGVQLIPFNYETINPSTQTVQMVRINYADGKVDVLDTFEQSREVCELNFTMTSQPGLGGYHGDVVVRKFPYDPNDPYYETDSIV